MKLTSKKIMKLVPVLVLAAPVLASGEEHGFNPVMFAAQWFNTLLFFGGLAYLLKKPLGEFFANRVAAIRASLELAEKSRAEAKLKLDEIEAKTTELPRELEKIAAQAAADAEIECERILSLARQDAERILNQAKAEVENRQRESLAELRAFLADLAVAEAEKIIRETLSDKERARLFAEFTERLEARS